MILVYRPENEAPPMAKECSIGFSFINGLGNPDYHRVESGVNRDFPEDVWEKIKGYPVVKNLLAVNAFSVIEEDPEAPEDDEPRASTPTERSLGNLAIEKAMTLIDSSMDVEQLKRWDEKEQRIRLKNYINKRITALQAGDG